MRISDWSSDVCSSDLAEILRQLHRLVDDALVLFGIPHLDIAGQREVLALRMALEAIVRQDAAQVGIALEDDAVHVEHLALQPAGDRPDVRDGGNGRSEEHTSELQSLMRISYAVFCLKKT